MSDDPNLRPTADLDDEVSDETVAAFDAARENVTADFAADRSAQSTFESSVDGTLAEGRQGIEADIAAAQEAIAADDD